MRSFTLLSTLLLALATEALAAAETWSPWRVLGPFPYSFEAGAENALPLADELALLAPGGPGPDPARVYAGFENEEVRWTDLAGPAAESTELDVGALSFLEVLPRGGERTSARVFLARRCESATAGSVSLVLGSDDGLRLWWNGALLVDQPTPRALTLGSAHVALDVQPGLNHLLVEVSQADGLWAFRMAREEPVAQTDVDVAIERGVRWLLADQLVDGSWGHHAGFGSGHAAFTAYTLLEMGVPPSHPAVRRAMAFARQNRGPFTYAAACEVLALCELEAGGDPIDRKWLVQRVEDLVGWQASSGLWSYPVHPDGGTRADADLSNTLYAALALHAAEKRGCKVPAATWKDVISGTLRYVGRETDADGPARPTSGDGGGRGFYYWPGAAVTGSMTTAGLSILALAEEHLGRKLSAKERTRVLATRTDGLRWLAVHLDYSQNPGAAAAHHYFFTYGVERVASLLGLDEIGGLDWYGDGARYLVHAQTAAGAWGAEPAVDSLLALLFLKRATRPTSGSQVSLGPRVWATEDPEADVHVRAQGDSPLSIYVQGFSRTAREAHTWPGEGGAGLHVRQVEYLARREGSADPPRVLGTVAGDPARPAGTERFAIRHSFPQNGAWLLTCRATVVPPADADAPASEVVLSSPELRVEIRDVFDETCLRYPTDAHENLFTEVAADASTIAADAFAAARALDGDYTTSWLSAPTDGEPWIRLRLARPARGGRLLLTHASPRPQHATSARPSRVSVRLDGGEEFVVDVALDPLQKTEIDLGKTKFKELSVLILATEFRAAGTQGVGFSEIQLLPR